jgi:hypothetical protein
MAAGQPVISVDTKKKELIGNFKNAGQSWCQEAEVVNDHDFATDATGKAVPYGIYDLQHNAGYVYVGQSADTAEFAVTMIADWWRMIGSHNFPGATQLLILCDGGGGNGSRLRLWKVELQKLADETRLEIAVSHWPPGTSKWYKIEHRLFSYISQNWRGKPLISHEVIVNLIAATTTQTGLKVRCQLDTQSYAKGTVVSDDELAQVNLRPNNFHGEWNYAISPRTTIGDRVIS